MALNQIIKGDFDLTQATISNDRNINKHRIL